MKLVCLLVCLLLLDVCLFFQHVRWHRSLVFMYNANEPLWLASVFGFVNLFPCPFLTYYKYIIPMVVLVPIIIVSKTFSCGNRNLLV